MGNFNKVILMGNLTRDPELRYTPKGQAVAKFGVAINRTYKTETGETKEEATFVDVEAWAKQAELLGQYFKKGSPIFLEGRLKLDQWDDKTTGQKVSKLRVVLERLEFVGGPRNAEGGSGGGAGGGPMGGPPSGSPMSRPAPRPAAPAPTAPPEGDGPGAGGSSAEVDDVPF